MKLFRGYKTQPLLMTPQLTSELNNLHKLYLDTVPQNETNITVAIQKMGSENFTRWVELRQAAGPQFFTDHEDIARDIAGSKGFVAAFEVDENIATSHYQGEQTIQHGKKQRAVSNFVFSGTELGKHNEDWKLRVIDIMKERERSEGEAIRT